LNEIYVIQIWLKMKLCGQNLIKKIQVHSGGKNLHKAMVLGPDTN